MLKINNNFKRYRIPLVAGGVAIGSAFLFQYLTFIPEYSSAEEISTPVYDESKKDTRTLSDITYMQEMTSGICERSSIEPTEEKQLIDKRDGKSYWVAKLKDGNCWMTQNLDLDLNNKTLTSDDSDVTSDWISTTGASTMVGYNSNNYYIAQYYDPGLGYCPNSGNCSSTSNSSNNGHDSQGNYYSWTAATAGTGDESISTKGQDAPSSICPKGWRLPSYNNTDITKEPTYAGLISAYEIENNSTGSEKLRSEPLYFIYGGGVDNGALNNAGSGGYYWSSTANSISATFFLYIFSSSTYRSYYDRYLGFPVRCVNNPKVSDVRIPEIDNPNVSVTVNPILTLEVSDKQVEITPKTDEVMTGDFTATVSANQPYTISLSSAEGYDTALTSESASKINAITSSQTVEAGKNGWGIRVCNDETHSNCDSYKGITPYGTNTLFYTSNTGAINHSTLFNIGIGINSNLPSGTYSTNILVTASQK